MQDGVVKIVSKPEIDIPYYLTQIINFFIAHWPSLLSGTKSLIGILIGLSIPVSVVLLIGILVSVERLKSIRKKEEEKYYPKVDMGYETVVKANPGMAKRWDNVQIHIESPNKNDWKQAIIDADIILGELLTGMGYRGSSIGEQLKRATKADFKTLDEAWDAHKIRNEIAHSGSEYEFNQIEAKRVIHLYKKVFEEFFYI